MIIRWPGDILQKFRKIGSQLSLHAMAQQRRSDSIIILLRKILHWRER